MLVTPYVRLFVASVLLFLSTSDKKQWLKERVIGIINKFDVKDIFNFLSSCLSALVELVPPLMPLLFCVTTLWALLLTDYQDIIFNHITSFSVMTGWILSFYWSSAFEPVYTFISALKVVILKEMMSFLSFYVFILLAYSYGMFIIISSVPSLLQKYPTVANVMFELLLVGCGADPHNSYDMGAEFKKAGLHRYLLFNTLFTSYIIITMVGLLNLIITSMCESYKKFTQRDNQGWLQHCIKMSHNSTWSYAISSKLLHCLFKKSKQRVYDNGHYYIEMNYKQA